MAYFDQGNHAKAIETMAAAAAVNPRDPEVREVLYKAHFQMGRDLSEKKETLPEAIKHYEASLKYNDICSKCQKIIRELIASAKEESNAYHYQQGKQFFLEGPEGIPGKGPQGMGDGGSGLQGCEKTGGDDHPPPGKHRSIAVIIWKFTAGCPGELSGTGTGEFRSLRRGARG